MRSLVVLLAQALLLLMPSWAHDMSHPGREHADILASRDVPPEDFFVEQAKSEGRGLCVIKPLGDDTQDDAPHIMDALNGKCRAKGLVFMPGPEYHIRTNMTTVGMNDVHIVLYGRMVWSKDIAYWTSVSMPVGFQNQSTVWYFGGDKVVWDGHNTGTLDGNGQVWYDWAKSEGNVARRPMNINFRNLTNSVVRGMRFVQSQMWTMAITYSRNVDLDDIYVNSTSVSRWSTLNTDGCDTINSDSITFRRWFVTNGDDAIALKGNSTNISIYDSEFRDGQGVAIGSLAQYNGRHDYVTNFYARNITLVNTAHVSYVKTWAGTSRGYPPNGGGGGLGKATNITMEDIRIERVREPPFFAWQCENYSGYAGTDCDSSKFQINHVAWRRVSGTVVDGRVSRTGSFQCSLAAGGCYDIEATDIHITMGSSGKVLDSWRCDNVHAAKGFVCDSSSKKSG